MGDVLFGTNNSCCARDQAAASAKREEELQGRSPRVHLHPLLVRFLISCARTPAPREGPRRTQKASIPGGGTAQAVYSKNECHVAESGGDDEGAMVCVERWQQRRVLDKLRSSENPGRFLLISIIPSNRSRATKTPLLRPWHVDIILPLSTQLRASGNIPCFVHLARRWQSRLLDPAVLDGAIPTPHIRFKTRDLFGAFLPSSPSRTRTPAPFSMAQDAYRYVLPQSVPRPASAEIDRLIVCRVSRLTLFLSSLVLTSNLVALVVYRRLPDDPLHIARHLSLYSYFAIALCAVGVVGARKVRLAPRAEQRVCVFPS